MVAGRTGDVWQKAEKRKRKNTMQIEEDAKVDKWRMKMEMWKIATRKEESGKERGRERERWLLGFFLAWEEALRSRVELSRVRGGVWIE